MEKALFPMKYLNVTQGMNGGFSHQGTEKIDFGGKDTGIDNVFAPYTGVIRKIYATPNNSVWLESLNPVKYADGTEDYMTIIFSHDNDISDLWVGKIVSQGDVFYQEGTAGQSTGNHVQLDVGRGKFTGSGWHDNGAGNWVVNNEYDPTKALWLRRDTIILRDGGYNWKVTDTDTFEEGSSTQTYTVKPGDTLYSIALKYGIDWRELYNANANIIGSNASNIRVGQILTIPKVTYYTVTSGDSLLSIARRFNTTWDKIYNDNKSVIGSNPNNIIVGQKLIIRP